MPLLSLFTTLNDPKIQGMKNLTHRRRRPQFLRGLLLEHVQLRVAAPQTPPNDLPERRQVGIGTGPGSPRRPLSPQRRRRPRPRAACIPPHTAVTAAAGVHVAHAGGPEVVVAVSRARRVGNQVQVAVPPE